MATNMKIFIFEEVENLTYRYHGRGSLVVIAKDKKHARLIIEKEFSKPPEKYEDGDCRTITKEEWKTVRVYDLVGKPKSKMWVFPDAGCC